VALEAKLSLSDSTLVGLVLRISHHVNPSSFNFPSRENWMKEIIDHINSMRDELHEIEKVQNTRAPREVDHQLNEEVQDFKRLQVTTSIVFHYPKIVISMREVLRMISMPIMKREKEVFKTMMMDLMLLMLKKTNL
jgi:hypothetical protein